MICFVYSAVRLSREWIRRLLPVASLFLLTAFVWGARAQNPAPTPPREVDVIRTETDLTNLLFTVTDRNNAYVTSLQQGDIRVLEDGTPQEIFTFQRETD